MMKKNKMCMLLAAACAMAALSGINADARPTRATNGAKYVFFFLGDGMASVEIQAAEAYLTNLNGGSEDSATDLMNPDNMLNMNKLPVMGMCTTFSDTRFITDSAAAATAFACGVKTESGVIGRNTAKDTSYKSIAELGQEQGRKIGIISSVSLPHATPAGYYANVNSRNNYNEIGYQAAQSGFDFFGGGRFRYLNSSDNAGGVVLSQAFADAGYTIITNKDEIMALSDTNKVICSVATSYDSDAMPYAMDNPEENISLADVTQAAINCLQDDPEGFFIMVEGGKIDWAGHANDAVADITDTLAFDEAIGKAIEFYNAHPNDTLIVVTGDHETGGMTLGFVGTQYETAFDVLAGQTKSYQQFINEDLLAYQTNLGVDAADWDAESMNIDDTMKTLIADRFGLVWDNLSAYQQGELEAAYDRTMSGQKADSSPSGYDLESDTDVDYITYGGYDALTVTLTHILDREAGLAWTSSSHTGVPVPVMALGFDSWRFDGFYDNTDIAKKLGQAMRTPALPVEDTSRAGALNY
jgi:alkaline phosphatase